MKNSIVIAALILTLFTSGESGAREASCGSLDIHINSGTISGTQDCETAQSGGVNLDGVGQVESIEINGPYYYVYMYHYVAGVRTYLTQTPLDELIRDSTSFAQIEKLTSYPSVRKFQVRRFVGVTEANVSVPCFAISRYAGTAFSGSRHLVFGLYCEFAGEQIEDARVEEVISAIDLDF
jgi:hypothetical protein